MPPIPPTLRAKGRTPTIKIRPSDIKGIQIENNAIRDDLREIVTKIQQFADDTTLFLRDKEDLDIAMAIFQ